MLPVMAVNSQAGCFDSRLIWQSPECLLAYVTSVLSLTFWKDPDDSLSANEHRA